MSTDETEQTSDSVFVTAVAIEMGLGVVALVLGWLTGVDPRQWIPRMEPDQWQGISTGLAIGAAAAVPMLIAIELVERIDVEPIRRLKELETLPIVASLLRLSNFELIAISVAAGVGEELLLRGWLMAWISGPLEVADPVTILGALLVSSVAFGLLHLITPTYAVIATFIGIYLGGLVLWTGNLLVPITAHAVYDAIHLLLFKRQQQRTS
ncbi:MAG: CPBP family intramembrane glutamic endopeptidase [Planctomycetaceae bacterium]